MRQRLQAGVGAVIAMVAVGSGAQERLTEQIQSLGTNLVLVRSSSTSIQGVRGGAGTRATLTDEDAMAIRKRSRLCRPRRHREAPAPAR